MREKVNKKPAHISPDGTNDLFPEAYAGNSTGPLKKAEQIMVEARQSDSFKKALKLARKALHIAPNCVDAYIFQAQMEAFNEDIIIENFTKAVEYARSNIGEARFLKMAGRFGADKQTDLFLQASVGFAHFYYFNMDYAKSQEILTEIVELDKEDRYKARPLLAAAYLLDNEPDEFKYVLDRFRRDESADMAYLRVLESYIVNGDSKRTHKLLEKALQANIYIPELLLDSESELGDEVEPVTPGSEVEAAEYVDSFLECWDYVEGSLEWLSKETGIEIADDDIIDDIPDEALGELENLILESYSVSDEEVITKYLAKYRSPFHLEDVAGIIASNMNLSDPPPFTSLINEMFPFVRKVQWDDRGEELEFYISFARLYYHSSEKSEPSEANVEKYLFSPLDPLDGETLSSSEEVVKQLLQRNNRINIVLRFYEQLHPDGMESVPAQTYIQLSYVGRFIDDAAKEIWKSRNRYNAYDHRELLEELSFLDENMINLFRAFISLIDIPIPDEIPKGEYMHILKSIERLKNE